MQTLILKLALGAAVIASAPAADAASDYLLELDGVKGESKASASIAEFRWSQALAGPAFDPFQPAFAGGVNVAVGDITGDGRWEELVLTATDPDDGSFFRYEMKDVLVTSYQLPAAEGHKEWIIIESMSGPLMRWSPPTASGGRGDWIEGSWDAASGRFIGDPAVLGAFDDLGAVRWADGTLAITAAVPEPASWALMALGTAAIGARLRRRRIAA
jgi:hypothetical protein